MATNALPASSILYLIFYYITFPWLITFWLLSCWHNLISAIVPAALLYPYTTSLRAGCSHYGDRDWSAVQFAVLLVEEAQVQLSSVEFGVYSLFRCPQQGPPTSFCFSFTFASFFRLSALLFGVFLCVFSLLGVEAACCLLLLLFVLTQKTELCLMGFCYVFWHFGNNVSASGLRCAVRAHSTASRLYATISAGRHGIRSTCSLADFIKQKSHTSHQMTEPLRPIFKQLIYTYLYIFIFFLLRYKL